MADGIYPPALAAVVAFVIRDFLRAPVADQVRAKGKIEAIVHEATTPLSLDSRVILDAAQGLVVVVLAGPAEALALAQRVRERACSLALSIGLDFGAVRAVDHERRGSGLVGDGIVAALALAGITAPGSIAASQAFRETLEWAAPHRARELVNAGSFMDQDTEAREMYLWDARARRTRRRRLLAAGVIGVAVILGSGVAARLLPFGEPAQPAVLEFDVAPAGEVIVDGVSHGMTPPLERLKINPGARIIEIRAHGYPALKLNVTLAPQQIMTIQHTFAKPAPRAHEKRGIIDSVRRRLGL